MTLFEELHFAPLQLAAQNLEIGFLRGLDQLEALGGTCDSDAVGGLHGDAFLSVEG